VTFRAIPGAVTDWWKRQHAFVTVMSRIGEVPYEQSIAELDALDLNGASTLDVAHWLNNRAYLLAQTGSPDQALEHLAEAEELIADEADRDWLFSCIVGTRGIAHLHAGDFDPARTDLERALAIDEPRIHDANQDIAAGARHLTAERLWWLAIIAEKQGNQRVRLDRLEQAARFGDTKYGDRARRALGVK
jgi:tetratricopeptide (TPR) repeat protein